MPSFAAFGNRLHTGETSFNFIGRRRVWYTAAVLAVTISLVALFTRGLNPGIEFRGGSEFQISQVKSTSELIGERAVGDTVKGQRALVSKLGRDSVRVQTDRLSDTQTDLVKAALAKAYGVPDTQVTSSYIGPSWGADVSQKAITGLVVFLILVGIVIALYFRTWKMALAALLSLLHDLIVTVGVYALVGFEVTPASVIGFLTILGYSLYDTVVVFDKVRENTNGIEITGRTTHAEATNLAVNQTLVRSINTSVVALLPVGSILFIGAFLLGAGTLKDISLALFIGIAAGTYSSIFIAPPVLVQLREREPGIQALARRVAARRSAEASRAAVPAGAATGAGQRTATALLERDGDDAGEDGDGAPAGGQRPRATGPRNQPKRGKPRPSGKKRR